MTAHTMDAPIFIGGLMKSGTSLLRKLLTQHPNIYGGLETHWFTTSFKDHWQEGDSERQDWLAAFYDMSVDEMQAIRDRSTSYKTFLDNFMRFGTERAGKSRWVEKTPDNVFHIAEIKANWPEAHVFIMYRDFRDTFASWKDRKQKGMSEFLPAAEHYLIEVHQHRHDITVIDYEDLVRRPAATLDLVLSSLDEPFTEDLADYQGDARDYNKVLEVTGKASATTESLQRPIFTTSVGQYRDLLEQPEIDQLDGLNQRYEAMLRRA